MSEIKFITKASHFNSETDTVIVLSPSCCFSNVEQTSHYETDFSMILVVVAANYSARISSWK